MKRPELGLFQSGSRDVTEVPQWQPSSLAKKGEPTVLAKPPTCTCHFSPLKKWCPSPTWALDLTLGLPPVLDPLYSSEAFSPSETTPPHRPSVFTLSHVLTTLFLIPCSITTLARSLHSQVFLEKYLSPPSRIPFKALSKLPKTKGKGPFFILLNLLATFDSTDQRLLDLCFPVTSVKFYFYLLGPPM